MDEHALSVREQQILAEVESELRADRKLDRELSTMRLRLPHRIGQLGGATGRVPVTVLASFAAVSLLTAIAHVHSADLLALFCLVWLTTAVLVGARAAARSRRRGR